MAEPRHFAEEFPRRTDLPVVKPPLHEWLQRIAPRAKAAGPTQTFPVPTNIQELRCGCKRPHSTSRNLKVRWSHALQTLVCVAHPTVDVGSTHPTGSPSHDEVTVSPVTAPVASPEA